MLRSPSCRISAARTDVLAEPVPFYGSDDDVAEQLTALLDGARDQLAAAYLDGMTDFVIRLNRLRATATRAEWRAATASVGHRHPALAYLHEEPFTRRAFEKPYGYAGDAGMLDLVYGTGEPPIGTMLGDHLHTWIVRQPACRSVQERRIRLADRIDAVAAGRPNARILSVACGHLREAQCATAVRAGHVAEFVAFDQDARSLAVVATEQAAYGVRPVVGTVRDLLTGRHHVGSLGTFDLIYSAGLYDYLDDRVAVALTAALFRMLRSGGQLVVANFAPTLRDIGYMEAVMDWHLVYRDEDALHACGNGIDSSRVAAHAMTRDDGGNVVYAEWTRA